MRIPRDVGGEELARLLKKYKYKVTRQTGSHIRLTTTIKEKHSITIPKHKPLKLGTLNSVLIDVAEHLQMDKQILIEELWGKGK